MDLSQLPWDQLGTGAGLLAMLAWFMRSQTAALDAGLKSLVAEQHATRLEFLGALKETRAAHQQEAEALLSRNDRLTADLVGLARERPAPVNGSGR